MVSGARRITPIQMTEEQVASQGRVRRWLLFDPLLLLAALGLIACSVITLKGPSHAEGYSYETHQLIYAGLGVLFAFVLTRFDYSRLREYRYGLYGLMIVLNLVVYGMPAIQGAHRWIPLPLLEFQSSEFGKFLLILSLAAFAVEASRRVHERRTTARLMLLALIPALLVIPQPDLGTALVYIAIAFMVIVFSGAPWKHVALLVGLFVTAVVFVLVLAPALHVHVLKPYQQQRLTTFINPTCRGTDPTCYQLHQSLIAIGSGGKMGRGVAHATQAQLNFLPVEQTDFIFAVLGETYGFVGAALVLSLYALLIWRALRIVTMSKNLYGSVIAGGILGMLMFQIFVNVGMTLGIMPVTGVPLPLFSYGGSSVLVTFLSVGLLQSIYIQARRSSGAKSRALIS
jgi:rod shape determining protein RodA